MTELLRAAFAALGGGLDVEELKRVAGALRASGDAETLALFDGDEAGYDGGYLPVLEVAQSVPGSDGFAALDLFTETCNPGAHRRVMERGRPSERVREELRQAEAARRWGSAGRPSCRTSSRRGRSRSGAPVPRGHERGEAWMALDATQTVAGRREWYRNPIDRRGGRRYEHPRCGRSPSPVVGAATAASASPSDSVRAR